jgi:hypothetical protein
MWGPNKTIETAIEHTGEEPQSRHYLHTTVQSYLYVLKVVELVKLFSARLIAFLIVNTTTH